MRSRQEDKGSLPLIKKLSVRFGRVKRSFISAADELRDAICKLFSRCAGSQAGRGKVGFMPTKRLFDQYIRNSTRKKRLVILLDKLKTAPYKGRQVGTRRLKFVNLTESRSAFEQLFTSRSQENCKSEL